MKKTTPKVLRMIQTIGKIESALLHLQAKPYGDGNPYYYCASCERSLIEVSSKGHYGNCKYHQLDCLLKSMRKQFSDEIKVFLIKEEYKKIAFTNYLWFKNDTYIEGMQEISDLIAKYDKSKKIPIELDYIE